MKNKKIMIVATSAVALTTLATAAFVISQQNPEKNIKIVNKEEPRKDEHAVIISEINAEGYTIFQGDTSFFKKGIIPYNAKILDSIVYQNNKYKFNMEDVQYELAQGYVIKINDKYYYYPQPNVAQTNIVTKEMAIQLAKANPHHEKYDFKPEDVVAEDENGYTIRHGDHYHYIYKRNLTSAQIANIKVPKQKEATYTGVTTPTSDGYLFKGEQDIIQKNNMGVIVKHNGHEHFIPYEAFKNTQWEYLIPHNAKPIIKHSVDNANTKTDHFIFSPENIINEDEHGYIVQHDDHFHYVSKNKNEVETPKTEQKEKQKEEPKEKQKPTTPTEKKVKFAGIDFKTSDDFLFDGTNIVTKTTTGLVVTHENHSHFIPYYQLVESKWESLIPETALTQAKQEYEDIYQKQTTKPEENTLTPNTEDAELTAKKAYLAKQLNLNIEDIKITTTPNGVAFVYPHADHYHTILINEIDPTKPIPNPHADSETGMQTLRILGFDDDIIHDILHANADTDFPQAESDPEKMKEWLKTVKMLNIGQNKDPLKRKGLDLMPNIEILGIGFTPIDDITPVYQFKKLKQLYVTNTGITNYDFLKNIPTLEGIDLSQNNVSDISFLKQYPNLKIVAAAGNDIRDISVLQYLPKLESINLDYNKIEDISALTNLSNLTAVSLEHNELTNLSALNNKQMLTHLFLSHNETIELDSLIAPSLRQLEIENDNIRNLAFLKNTPKLQTLKANNNKISNLKYLNTNTTLETLYLNNNQLENLNGSHPNLNVLEVENNDLDSLRGIEQLTALEILKANTNQITDLTLPNPQNSLRELYINHNNIQSLNAVNQYPKLSYLETAYNFIKTLHLDTPNQTLEYLDVSHNNIPKSELFVDTGSQIPNGIEKNFKHVTGGEINDNYPLTKEYILDEVAKVKTQIETLFTNKKITEAAQQELTKQLRYIELDLKYAVKITDTSLQEAMRTIFATKATIDELAQKQLEQPQQNQEEDKVTFNIEMIQSEDENGYVVKHNDHLHYILKKDLTPKQIEDATNFLNNKATNAKKENFTQAEIDAKINYIALLYGIEKTNITLENNILKFDYHGARQESLSDIIIPIMSDDLEADFEKELNTIAESMNISPENINIKDGMIEVPHGGHSHFYKIKSPGWRTYIENKLPFIEVPFLSGSIDETVVNAKIISLENKARKVLSNKKLKLTKALNWLNDFRENTFAWRSTSTEGYLKALEKFEELVLIP